MPAIETDPPRRAVASPSPEVRSRPGRLTLLYVSASFQPFATNHDALPEPRCLAIRPDLSLGHPGGRGHDGATPIAPDILSAVSAQKIDADEYGFAGVLDRGDRFGRSVTTLGDPDQDGVIDIAVGVRSPCGRTTTARPTPGRSGCSS